MQKAFIFDVDGVLANTEPFWEEVKDEVFHKFLDKNVITAMGSTVGINMEGMYDLAVKYGAVLDKKEFFDSFYEKADWVYENATLTPGLEELGNTLSKYNYAIALVSASPKDWIDKIACRLPFQEQIRHIISLEDRADLPHKPAPDGYLEAMKELGAIPEATVILEDSNTGIESAKSSGAYVIGLKQNLVPGYDQRGADIYAQDLQEVVSILKNRN